MATTIVKRINNYNISVGNFIIPTPVRALPIPELNSLKLYYVGQQTRDLRASETKVVDANGVTIIDGSTPGVTRSQVIQAINNFGNIS